MPKIESGCYELRYGYVVHQPPWAVSPGYLTSYPNVSILPHSHPKNSTSVAGPEALANLGVRQGCKEVHGRVRPDLQAFSWDVPFQGN